MLLFVIVRMFLCLFVCLFVCLLFLFWSFLYSVLSYSLSSPPRIAMLTAGYNGLCNLIEGNKVCCVFFVYVSGPVVCPPSLVVSPVAAGTYSASIEEDRRDLSSQGSRSNCSFSVFVIAVLDFAV